jgi:hypothetical protein
MASAVVEVTRSILEYVSLADVSYGEDSSIMGSEDAPVMGDMKARALEVILLQLKDVHVERYR